MHSRSTMRIAVLLAALQFAAVPAAAVTIQIDYTYDTGFFNTSAKRAPLQAAATYYSGILTDTLAAIPIPPSYTSPRVSIQWTWEMSFGNPSGAGTITRDDQTVPADVVRVFVGSQVLPGDTLAFGGPGGHDWGRPTIPIPPANSTDVTQINAIDASFGSAVVRRGETTGFARWGGSISFDSDRTWHFNPTTTPPAGASDLYSVAIHELAHVLAFGATNVIEWTNLVSGSSFTGPAATASYGGPVPLSGGHWAANTNSTVFGTSNPQTAIMVSNIPPGTRRQLTTLDAAALTDLGWSVVPPPTPPGDYNRNGVVDAADYVLWRNTMGQSVAAGTGADGSGNGSVGNEDYTYWRTRLGNTSGNASGASLGGAAVLVPEPGSGALFIAASLIAALFPRRMRTHR